MIESPDAPVTAITQPVKGRLRLVKLLLDYRANPKQKISLKYGSTTPLQQAAKEGNHEIVKLLEESLKK